MGVATAGVLGPLVLATLRYRTSDTTLKQIMGGDLAALVVVAPTAVAAGTLLWGGHRAGPVVALAPALWAVYMYAQLIVGQATERGGVHSPTAFWIVKLMDLGIIAPAAVAIGVGLLRDAVWAREASDAIFGGYTLLAAAVAGMAIVMYVNADPDASLANVAVFATFTAGFAWLTVALCRPLFVTPRPLSSGGDRRPGSTTSRHR